MASQTCETPSVSTPETSTHLAPSTQLSEERENETLVWFSKVMSKSGCMSKLKLNCVTWERGALASGVGTAHLDACLEGKTLRRTLWEPCKDEDGDPGKGAYCKSPTYLQGRASNTYPHTV